MNAANLLAQLAKCCAGWTLDANSHAGLATLSHEDGAELTLRLDRAGGHWLCELRRPGAKLQGEASSAERALHRAACTASHKRLPGHLKTLHRFSARLLTNAMDRENRAADANIGTRGSDEVPGVNDTEVTP